LIVKESIAFQRHKDPKTALGLDEKAELYETRILQTLENIKSKFNIKKKIKIISNDDTEFAAGFYSLGSFYGISYYGMNFVAGRFQEGYFMCSVKEIGEDTKWFEFDNIEECEQCIIEHIKSDDENMGFMRQNESISFQRHRDPMTALGLGEKANLYRRTLEKIVEELKEEYPNFLGDVVYPPPNKEGYDEKNFIIGIYDKVRNAYFSINYSLDTSKKDAFLLTYQSHFTSGGLEVVDSPEEIKSIISYWIEEDLEARIIKESNNLNNMKTKIVNETLDKKLTDQEICDLIDDEVSTIEDHLVFVMQLEGQEFIDEFNKEVRDMFPQLKNDHRNFYEIYDAYRS